MFATALPLFVHDSFLHLRPSIWEHFLSSSSISCRIFFTLGSNVLRFCLSENVFISSLFLKDIFTTYEILGWQLCFYHHIEYFIPLSSGFGHLSREICYQLNCCSFESNLIPFSLIFYFYFF